MWTIQHAIMMQVFSHTLPDGLSLCLGILSCVHDDANLVSSTPPLLVAAAAAATTHTHTQSALAQHPGKVVHDEKVNSRRLGCLHTRACVHSQVAVKASEARTSDILMQGGRCRDMARELCGGYNRANHSNFRPENTRDARGFCTSKEIVM